MYCRKRKWKKQISTRVEVTEKKAWWAGLTEGLERVRQNFKYFYRKLTETCDVTVKICPTTTFFYLRDLFFRSSHFVWMAPFVSRYLLSLTQFSLVQKVIQVQNAHIKSFYKNPRSRFVNWHSVVSCHAVIMLNALNENYFHNVVQSLILVYDLISLVDDSETMRTNWFVRWDVLPWFF